MSSPTKPQDAPPANRLRFFTGDLPERDRLAVWHELHGRTLFNVGFEPYAETPFYIDAGILPIANSAVSAVTGSPARHYVAREHLPTAKETTVIVMVKSGLVHARQRDLDVTVGPGQAFAILSHEIASIDLMERSDYLCIYLPTVAVASLVPDLGKTLMRPIGNSPAALPLLMSYTESLHAVQTPLSPNLAHIASTHLTDLMAHTLGCLGEAGQIAEGRGVRAARRRAVKTYIANHLMDETLSPDEVASRLGITPRYMRKLLQDEGTSFSDLLRQMRLQMAYDRLSDPRHGDRLISTVAYQVGFSDLSYFNRCFRQQFGLTPGEVRHRTRLMN